MADNYSDARQGQPKINRSPSPRARPMGSLAIPRVFIEAPRFATGLHSVDDPRAMPWRPFLMPPSHCQQSIPGAFGYPSRSLRRAGRHRTQE